MTQNEPCEFPMTDGAVFDALQEAVIVADRVGTVRRWNAGAERLFGWPRDEIVGRSLVEMLVPLTERVRADEIMTQVRAGEPWRGDITLLRRDAEPLRVALCDYPIHDEAGEVVAVVAIAEDVSDRRLLEQQTVDLAEHLRLALEAGGLGTFRWDRATGVTTWDERTEALYGLAPDTFEGTFDAWQRLIHPDDRAGVLAALDRAIDQKGAYTLDHRVVWPDGTVRWIHGAGRVTVDGNGSVTGAIGCTVDITDRMAAEEERRRLTAAALAAAEREREHRERLEVLGRINDALAASRSMPALMTNVVNAVVPRLADWASLYVLPTPEAIFPVIEVAHVDPAMVRFAHELQERFPYDPSAPTGVPAVMRDGHTEFFPDIDEEVLAPLALDEEVREIIDGLALRSAITVPLVKRGRIVGAMSFIMTSSRRRYTADDVAIAQAAAARIASSIENLRLSTLQREIAATLQASLLPPTLPEIPGVDVAVRYWPAGEGVEVGGDFYDVFAVDGEHWAVVMGDVCGTGPTAAATTGLARHTLAGAVWLDLGPEEVLRHLNTTLRRRSIDTFLTIAYGYLQPAAGGIRVTLAIGGHPLPAIVRADGTVEVGGSPGTLLGMLDDIKVTATEHLLAPGDTLVLHTDGVTDVPPPHDLTPDAFRALVGRAATGAPDVDTVAERIRGALDEILPIERRSDDIALLVLRVA
jgi:PAS domain S-box-containing protein